MSSRLPGGPWRALFPRALLLIDEIRTHGGISDPFWTFGGGTVLMLRYRHRLSKDIDIFVPDPQYLGFVTPRLSDAAADLTADYTELAGSFVKLQFEEGEIDFVAAPNLVDDAWEDWRIGGRIVKVETAGEIIAKKMYHRGDRVTARDLFDFALVVEREPQQLAKAKPFLLRHRQTFTAQIQDPHPSLRAALMQSPRSTTPLVSSAAWQSPRNTWAESERHSLGPLPLIPASVDRAGYSQTVSSPPPAAPATKSAPAPRPAPPPAWRSR